MMDKDSTQRAQTSIKPPPVPMLGPDRSEGAPLSVLVADGEPMVQQILRAAFERRGWFVCQALDGREAVEFMKAEHFDLAVLDLNLAFINGFEVLGTLAELPAKNRARAVILSAQSQPESMLRAFKLGADDFVEKPVNPEVLIARIERLIER